MIDIHTHILYGVDDGADTPEMSQIMLKDAATQGIDKIIFTPHYRPGIFKYDMRRWLRPCEKRSKLCERVFCRDRERAGSDG